MESNILGTIPDNIEERARFAYWGVFLLPMAMTVNPLPPIYAKVSIWSSYTLYHQAGTGLLPWTISNRLLLWGTNLKLIREKRHGTVL